MRRLTLIVLLAVTGCASPQEKAMKRAMQEYRRASAECAAHAGEHLAALAAAARAFHKIHGRWPYMLSELAAFASQNRLPLDDLVFNDATFASMSDGSLQIRYEINCARFDMNQKFTQRGLLKVKAR